MRLLYVADVRVDAYLVNALREAGHVVDACNSPADGLEMASGDAYQAIVADWSASFAGHAAGFADSPARGALLLVIMPAGHEAERAAVLAAGADVCFTRPVPFIELEARLAALARLVQRGRPGKTPAAGLASVERSLRLNGRSTPLSGREFQLMQLLLDHPGEVIGVDRLSQHIRGEDDDPRPDLTRASLQRLRRKLDATGAEGALRLVAGHGYVFDPRRQPRKIS
jgi:OmpR-family two-component system manganese-sensing response regulator